MTLKIHCPECRGQFQVDGEESRSRFECPFCSAPFKFQDKQTVVLSSSPLTRVEVEKVEGVVPATGPGSPPPIPGAAPAPGGPRPNAPSANRETHSPVPEDLTPLRPGDVLGGYRLEEVIGWGGMSVVFRAKQLSLGRDVAVKVMRHELGEDPEFSRRFLNEARALAELSHPNIVQVIDQGIHEGNHYLVMEYIDGVSLRDVLGERQLTPAEALRLVPDLCSALEYAHDRGIIHRDIKPENILVTKSGLPKVADFGLVRMLGKNDEEVSRITQTRTVLGTVDYMAPEQRAGVSDVDHRADIYSLGVVLYEMLTGELPIARFALPSERVQVDVRLDDVVLKVLEKDRDRRYQRASLVATDLQGLGNAPASHRSLPPFLGGRRVSRSLVGRVLALAWFPLGILFFAAAGDEELAFAVLGASIPWFLVHLRSYGWLPALPEEVRSKRGLMIIAAVVLFILVQNRALDDEAGLFAISFLISGAIALRRSVWNDDPSSAPAARPFSALPGLVRTASEGHPSHPGVGVAAAPAPASAGGPSAVAPADPSGSSEEPPIVSPSAPEKERAMSRASLSAAVAFPAAGSKSVSGATPGESEASPPRTRTSLALLFGFLFSLLTLLFSAGLSVPMLVTGDTWQTAALNLPIEYHEVREAVDEVAPFAPDTARAATSVVRLGLFAPLAIPLLLTLLSLPAVLTGRRRGPALLFAVLVLLAVQAGLIGAATRPVVETVDVYCREFAESPVAAPAALAAAEEATNPITRLARLHRAAGAGPAGPADPEAGAPLVRMALDVRLTPQERKVALAVLERNHADQLSTPGAYASCPDWVGRFARFARRGSETSRELRAGFVEVLSHVPDADLAPLFGELVVDHSSRTSLLALRWWIDVAPEEPFDRWVEGLRQSGSSSHLAHDIDRLVRIDGGNPRVLRLHEAVVPH